MPGNKNSGRKKKNVDEVGGVNEVETLSNPPQRRGRPQKILITEVTIDKTEATSHDRDPGEEELTNAISTRSSCSTTHVSTLNRRNSELSKFYDTHLGAAIDKFPVSKLPTKRIVLQRYRALRSESHTTSKCCLIDTITSELINLWDCSSIPHKDYKGCQYMVKTIVNKWADAKQDKKKSVTFQEDLNSLLDLRTVECLDLDVLKSHLKSSGNTEWEEDLNFFNGQMMFPQTTFMSPTKDRVLYSKQKVKAVKAVKALSYAEKNKGDFSCTTSSSMSSSEVHSAFEITKENITQEKSRKAAERTKAKIMDAEKHEEEETENSTVEDNTMDDADWELPNRERRRLSTKPKNITITLPSRDIPTLMACASTATKTSIRQELKLMSTLLKAGGADINAVNISVSTIYRQRKTEVTTKAVEIKNNIKNFGKMEDVSHLLVLHWDGKIVQLLSGEKEDRLAIAISVPQMIPGQFLASPVIPDGTGLSMANSVFEIANEFGLVSKAEAVVFDTTASNTGRWKGSVTRFEKKVGRALLWLACRHHVLELHIKHANELLRGESKGPDDPMFKEFKAKFSFLSLKERTLWTWPANCNDWRHQRATEVLEWADHHMELATWSREDYRELLELTVIFFGGVVKRVRNKQVQIVEEVIRKPGAIHRARFMASCLYLLKIFMYKEQLDNMTINAEAEQVEVLAEYIALLHVPYFLQCPLAISAPRLDRDFWVDLNDYQKCFNGNQVQHNMITVIQESMKLHLWYLCEELVIFGLFDCNLPSNERRAMADRLLQMPRPRNFRPRKPVFPTNLMSPNPQLEIFVGRKSWLLFHKLQAEGEWLQKDVDDWKLDEEFQRIEESLHDLKVVNDLAERCVKDIEEYANAAKDSAYRDDILLVATDHRGVFQDLRKASLL